MRSSETNIFLNEKVYSFFQEPPKVKHSLSKEDQDEYISQFFESQTSRISQEKFQKQNENAVPAIQPQLQKQQTTNSSSELIPNLQNLEKKQDKRRSFFHNFQKHLVVTLRNVVCLPTGDQDTEVQRLASQMWLVFTHSSLFNKKFLSILYGVNKQNEDNELSKTFILSLGFMQIFAKYSEESIQKAQRYLRRQTLRSFDKLNLKYYIRQRKIKREDQFMCYIREFLDELENGFVFKRLPKQKKYIIKEFID